MHAKLTRSEDGYVIEDLSSRNGTYVNDSPVERQLLKDGDEIRIGRVLLEYGHVFDVS
jgi:pSer/pThr/pTyr-binding forkhead associated (FHA) protein